MYAISLFIIMGFIFFIPIFSWLLFIFLKAINNKFSFAFRLIFGIEIPNKYLKIIPISGLFLIYSCLISMMLLSCNGYCFQQNGFQRNLFSDEYLENQAIRLVLKDNRRCKGDSCIESEMQSKDITQFRLENPNCCRYVYMIEEDLEDRDIEIIPSDIFKFKGSFLSRLKGNLYGFIKVQYSIKDKNGKKQRFRQYFPVTNCGKVRMFEKEDLFFSN
ncbi:hypothetical protein [Stenoxybacter acetivorans]|uniref:hypothetical protein n=1 Tax=Stenoxybacter acetivorans TaxID=422441 RepID=UPI000569255E|nr:hypothetical protein [Stenoxybacter acetivorans]